MVNLLSLLSNKTTTKILSYNFWPDQIIIFQFGSRITLSTSHHYWYVCSRVASPCSERADWVCTCHSTVNILNREKKGFKEKIGRGRKMMWTLKKIVTILFEILNAMFIKPKPINSYEWGKCTRLDLLRPWIASKWSIFYSCRMIRLNLWVYMY